MSRRGAAVVVDESGLRVREATFLAGVWLSYVVCGAAAVYIACTWERPHRIVLSLLFGCGVLATALVSVLPRRRIVASAHRELFFLSWSMLDLGLIATAVLLDGGTASPLSLVFFLPVVFAATSYPLASVIGLGTVTVGGYLALAVIAGGAGWTHQAIFSVTLACTCAMSGWMARNQEAQRTALLAISRSDPLTGCLNRRGFEERAHAALAAAARGGGRGAVLVFDIDHFKEVNDRHGHAAGDALLRWVVQAVQGVVREPDAVGRLGGDEFAILLPGADERAARVCADRLLGVLAERAPCSLGLACFPGDGRELEALIRAADGRLYARRRGRPARERGSRPARERTPS